MQSDGKTPSGLHTSAASLQGDGPVILKFPDDFLWGVATSHFQIEGNRQEIKHRISDWSNWTAQEGRILDQSTADRACDFLSHYEADVDLCQSMNLNTFRLSLNWPALMPKAGATEMDPEMVKFYRTLLQMLKDRGFKTFVTLFHFCLPTYLSDAGGWRNPKTIDEFERFTELVVKEFGAELVDFWLTLNEPLAYSYQGFIGGSWPPGGKGDYVAAFEAIRNLLEGHARSYAVIHRLIPQAKVSFTVHWMPFVPRASWNPFDKLTQFMRDEIFNHLWMRSVETGNLQFVPPLNIDKRVRKLCGVIPGLRGSIDFLGINYYTRQVSEFEMKWPPDIFGIRSDLAEFEVSSLGWEIYPDGLYKLLTHGLDPYRYDDQGNAREIYITENGLASMFSAELTDGDWSLNDELRVNYLLAHLIAVHKAVKAGANVKGYLHWSLLDNFEWSEGLRARFGLVRVAYPTLERTMRKSAKIFAEIVGQNALVDPVNSFYPYL